MKPEIEVKKLFREILTGKDNKTYDSGRFWFAISILYFFAMGIYSEIKNHPWSPVDIATGISVIAVAFSMNMRIKDTTEPPQLFEPNREDKQC